MISMSLRQITEEVHAEFVKLFGRKKLRVVNGSRIGEAGITDHSYVSHDYIEGSTWGESKKAVRERLIKPCAEGLFHRSKDFSMFGCPQTPKENPEVDSYTVTRKIPVRGFRATQFDQGLDAWVTIHRFDVVGAKSEPKR